MALPPILSPELTVLLYLIFSQGIIHDAIVVYSILVVFAPLIRICSPRVMTQIVLKSLDDTERIYHGAIQAGVFNYPSPVTQQDITGVENALSGLQVTVSTLRATSLRASWQPWKEIWLFFRGHSFCLLRCLRAILELQTEIQLLKEACLRELHHASFPAVLASALGTPGIQGGPAPSASTIPTFGLRFRHMSASPCTCGAMDSI